MNVNNFFFCIAIAAKKISLKGQNGAVRPPFSFFVYFQRPGAGASSHFRGNGRFCPRIFVFSIAFSGGTRPF
jgi:hypothetical protein